jgi:VanZ family protein
MTTTFGDQEHCVDRLKIVSRYIFGVGIIAIATLSLLPGNDVPSVGVSDKIQHLVAYALLGLAGGWAFPTRRGVIVLLVLLPLLGVALEIAQLRVPERSADVADALADWIGAGLTLLPTLVVRLRFG